MTLDNIRYINKHSESTCELKKSLVDNQYNQFSHSLDRNGKYRSAQTGIAQIG